jgi:nitroimidazol reductase NimA-like FMN-containing flavoprotein (pyridoxamine 5'-phosphate oxidase superfamily)
MSGTDIRRLVSMTDGEVAAVLHQLGRAMGPRGNVHLSAVWYGITADGLKGFTAHESSQKIRNLERDARITVLVEDGDDYRELRGLQVLGLAEFSRDAAAKEALSRHLHQRYRPRRAWPEPGESMGRRVAVPVQPKKVASWDHAKFDSSSRPTADDRSIGEQERAR